MPSWSVGTLGVPVADLLDYANGIVCLAEEPLLS